MADKKIYIDDSPKNPGLKKSPFDWTYTTNLTGRFGKVNCAMMKYLPPNTKLKIKPYFAFDMHSLVYPVQTNIRCHLKFYKVPLRILWKDFEDFTAQIGSNGLPVNGGGEQYVRPYIKRPTGWNPVGSLAEQVGCCNRKLSSVTENVNIDAEFYKGSPSSSVQTDGLLNLLGPSAGFGPFFYWLKLPINSLLAPVNVDGYELTSFVLSYISNNISSANGSYDVEAYVLGNKIYNTNVPGLQDNRAIQSDQGYIRIASTTVSTFTSSASNYNSSDVSCFARSSTEPVFVNGLSSYSRKVYLKIVDASFNSLVNQHLAQDETVYIRIVPKNGQDLLFFPDGFTSPFTSPRIRNSYLKIDKDDETQDLTYSVVSEDASSSFGATYSALVGLTRVFSEIDTKFDSVEGADPVQPISALPFRALEFIHNYFYRNPRIDPFVKDGVPTYNRFLTNDGSGADETTPIDSWNALYETDYFTSCVKEPQFGNAPLVGVTVNDTSDTGILTFSDGTGFNDYTVKLNLDEEGNVSPLTVYKEDADHPNINRLKEMIDFGISINDLRNVSTFQRMLERMQRTEHRFANVIYEFFGTNPPVGDHYPQYLGGVSRNVTVDKITNVAESDGHPLGSFAGQGKFRGEGESISVFTTEPSYIVCIQYFTVTPTYSQYLPKHLLYTDPLDFYLDPSFAFMGPQPVFKKELAPNQITAEHLNDVFGYNRPYAELFGNVDEVHGLYKTDMANYLLQRFFGDAPELNKSFIEINSADLTNIFSVVENTDKMFGQVLFKMSASLPAPRSYLPRSI